MSFIKKQIKLSEQDILKALNGLSPRGGSSIRKSELEEITKITKDLPTFLSSMGSNLISLHLSAGNVTDESQDSNADLQETLKEFLVIIVQED